MNASYDEEIKEEMRRLNRYSRGRYVAPHKPLMLLFMLGRYWHGGTRLVVLREINASAGKLMEILAVKDVSQGAPFYPFWHLGRHKSLWDLHKMGLTDRPTKQEIKLGLRAGFTEHLYRRIIYDKVFLLELVFTLLDCYFPESKHATLLRNIGIPDRPEQQSASPANKFRKDVLLIYQHSCVVCDFGGNFSDQEVCVQAAHIMWPWMGGPYSRDNGLALCNNHRELFDHGAFTLTEQHKVKVSEKYTDRGGDSSLRAHEGQEISLPTKNLDLPNLEYVTWHNERVFRQ